MTYCIAMWLNEGLIFASDTRTNAGVDQIASFRKMHLFQQPGARCFALLTSGNLATSQNLVSRLRSQLENDEQPNLYNAGNMFEAAEIVGEQIKAIIAHNTKGQQNAGVDFGCHVLFGGQIEGEPPRLYHIYPEGNFIEATEDTPYFQIGESKYGKPILDRIIRHDTNLHQAMKCALISFDSTMHSNLSVGMPLDVAVYRNDALELSSERIQENDGYFQRLRESWSTGIRQLFNDLP
ncbi:proteasome-type protease [Microbulbifer bruguierae]|uniref:Proteasome-type protease n=1 Tax=Microbulbifer bruguierae TaxID=3029061 RepID=A0ABY8NGZ8_9GAMM|nr:proteasome-type protease [Microbulbifer bruguierae]WGL16788.1 proteasome-type protease [Microbulbifer bruguierae]